MIQMLQTPPQKPTKNNCDTLKHSQANNLFIEMRFPYGKYIPAVICSALLTEDVL